MSRRACPKDDPPPPPNARSSAPTPTTSSTPPPHPPPRPAGDPRPTGLRTKLTAQISTEALEELGDALVWLPSQGVQASVAGIIEQALS